MPGQQGTSPRRMGTAQRLQGLWSLPGPSSAEREG